MSKELEDIVPDFVLGDELSRWFKDSNDKESVCYTLEQNRKGSFIYGMNRASYVKSTVEVPSVVRDLSTDRLYVEALAEMKKRNRKLRCVRYCVTFVLCALLILIIILFLGGDLAWL